MQLTQMCHAYPAASLKGNGGLPGKILPRSFLNAWDLTLVS